MTTIDPTAVMPLGQPGAAPAPSGVAPHEQTEAVTGGGAVEAVGAGTGAYYAADSEYYTTSEYATVPDLSSSAAGAAAPTLAEFRSLGVFTESDIELISNAQLSAADLTELYRGAAALASGATDTAATATGGGSTAVAGPSLQDFANLGVFTQEDLAKIEKANLDPDAAIRLYEQTVARARTPQGAGSNAGPMPSAAAAPLTEQEQQLFPQALAVAQQQLAAPEVAEAVRTELRNAGMDSSDAAVAAALDDIAASYETPEGARELMDRAVAEGWFAQGTPGWDASWKERFSAAIADTGVTRRELDRLLKQYEALGLTAADLETELANLTSPDAAAYVDQMIEATKPGWTSAIETQLRTALQGAGVTKGSIDKLIQEWKSQELSAADLEGILTHIGSEQGAAFMLQLDQQIQADGTIETATMGTMFGAMGLYGAHVGMRAVMRNSPTNVAKTLLQMVTSDSATALQKQWAVKGLAALDTPAAKAALAQVPKTAVNTRYINSVAKMDDAALATVRATAGRMLESHATTMGRLPTIARSNVKAVGAALNPANRLTTGQAAKMAAGYFPTRAATMADDIIAAGTKAGATSAAAKAAANVTANTAAKLGTTGLRAASLGAKAIPVVGVALAAGLGAWQISETVKAENGVGRESAKAIGSVTGGLAGAAFGAALGGILGVGVASVPLGIIGGAVFGFLGSVAGEAIGGGIHDAYMAGQATSGAAAAKASGRPLGGTAAAF